MIHLMHRDGGTRASMIDLPFVTMGLRSRYRTCGVTVIHRIRMGGTQTISQIDSDIEHGYAVKKIKEDEGRPWK